MLLVILTVKKFCHYEYLSGKTNSFYPMVKIQNTKFKEQKIKMRLKQLKMSKLKNWIPL